VPFSIPVQGKSGEIARVTDELDFSEKPVSLEEMAIGLKTNLGEAAIGSDRKGLSPGRG
jgi:hypothetical protein